MIYDLAIIGGGINGCGIARDAAGRGLSVALFEQDDLASATSSWSSKLIHGGLRYLEQYEFRLVRESLQEREVLLKLAPHIIEPLAFVLPHNAAMRPAWMIRLGMLLYDRLGGRISLPRSSGLSLPDKVWSAGLKGSFKKGFRYSDARVDDARLTVLNAVAAREEGAQIFTRSRVVRGERRDGIWHLVVEDIDTQARRDVTARGLVNAAGPWVKHVLDDALRIDMPATVRLVKGSHIVVPRVHEENHAYILQNDDGRVVFIIPYEGAFTLIGTTDLVVPSVEAGHAIVESEIAYLLEAANRYLAKRLTPDDVRWTYAGVRPLYDDGEANPAEITRDYVLKIDHAAGAAPLLSIFGGKITTYRRLAEHALAELKPFFPQMAAPWTHTRVLPGGDVDAGTTSERHALSLLPQHPGVPPDLLIRMAHRHGTRAATILRGVRGLADLGELFGAGAHLLCEREIDFLIREEWARTPDDILWRRTKCGLHMDAEERTRCATFIAAKLKAIAERPLDDNRGHPSHRGT